MSRDKFAWHVTTVRAVWVGSSAVFRTRIWWASQLVVETIIGKLWFEVEIAHYATQRKPYFHEIGQKHLEIAATT